MGNGMGNGMGSGMGNGMGLGVANGMGMSGGSGDGNGGCSGGNCGGGSGSSTAITTHGSEGVGITVNTDGSDSGGGPDPSHISISFKDTQLIIAKKGTKIPGVDIDSGKVIPFDSAGTQMI